MIQEKHRPPHLRPMAAGILPTRRVPQVARREAAAAHAPYRIPEEVQRVVVLSNVTRGFPAFALRAGDLVIHCNLAAHRDEAMGVPGTRHWIFVRHGKKQGERARVWFTPRDFTGFDRVFFIDDAELAAFRWRAEWRSLYGRISPTTGFIVANIVRELAPELPLFLVGFDPAKDHGTSRWRGHNWEAEAAWYEQRGYKLIKPGFNPKLALLVCSCAQPQFKGLRQACRDTWLSQLPTGVEYRFFVGADEPLPDEPDVICLPGVADTYIGLPEKVLAAIEWAHAHMQWDFLGKVDDDTYLRADRLLPLLTPDVHLLGRSRAGRRCPGGAGYFMSRAAVTKLVEHKSDMPTEGDEDSLITQKMVALGYSITDCYQLKQGYSEGVPEEGNNIISGHQLKRPEMHYACHSKNK